MSEETEVNDEIEDIEANALAVEGIINFSSDLLANIYCLNHDKPGCGDLLMQQMNESIRNDAEATVANRNP